MRIPVGAALVARRRLIDGLGSIERAPASLAQGLNGHLHDASTQIERTVGTCLKDGASLAGQLQKRVLRRR